MGVVLNDYDSNDRWAVLVSESQVRVKILRTLTNEEHLAYLQVMTDIMQQEFTGTRRGVVVDSTEFLDNNAVHRKQMADWIEQNRKLLKQTTMGVAIVVSNSMARNALRAVFWLQEMPVPYKVFGAVVDADAWVEQCYIDEHYGEAAAG